MSLSSPQLSREARDQVCKALQKRREEITRRLVHEPTLGIELLVRTSDENLRLQERVRVREYKCLPQLRLAARGSGHAGRGSHHSGDFTVQCAVARWPGQPVDRVLQHAWNAVVVFGSGDQQAVRLPNGIAKLHHARRGASSFYIAVVQRDSVQLVNHNV